MKAVKRTGLQILLIFLTITLIFPQSACAQVSELEEVCFFLRNYYVDSINEDVLKSPSVDALLAKLNDPYTYVMSSEEFEELNSYVDQRFSGVGINIAIVKQGVQITAVVKGSSADKSGLQVGDILTTLDGRSLQGLSLEEVIPLIKGAEGTWVQFTYLRNGESLTVKVERTSFAIPSVTSEIKPFNTGYLILTSFGSDTGKLFGECLNTLRLQSPKSYIVDLRNNGGGYGQTALDIAGYFIGDKLAMQMYNHNSPPYPLRAVKHDYIVDKPTIFVVNHYSASASEAMTMAVRDYGKTLVVGTQTYGKGCGQQIFPLSRGGYLKMTTSYYSGPLSISINKKGITPDLLIEKEDPLKVSLLLLSGSDLTSNDSEVKLILASQALYINTQSAREPEYWRAYGEILDKTGLRLMKGKAGKWEGITQEELTDRRSLYYPDYKLGNEVPGLIVDKGFNLHFSQNIKYQSINGENIELVDTNTGERVPLAFTQLNGTDVKAVPQKSLLSSNYWVVVHPAIQYADESFLPSGVVFSTAVKTSGNSGINGEPVNDVFNI